MKIDGLQIHGWLGIVLLIVIVYIAYRFGRSRSDM